jgi:redox-sensitive bicupin YhaK (pirin superfamily)
MSHALRHDDSVSGPLRVEDIAGDVGGDVPPSPPSAHIVEVTPSREALVGEATVRRALPTRGRRTVGPWCFLDHAPEALVDARRAGMRVGPHPHIGLQTVTWLLDGEVVHRDSIGSEQSIRPGQLNLMSAGRGVVHAEETPASYRGRLHGVQLWVAQPDRTRHGPPAFEHHGELPRVELDNATATVIVGALAGAASPARRDSETVGVELALRAGRTVVPVEAAHEYALVALDGTVAVGVSAVDEHVVAADQLAYLGTGRSEIAVTVATPVRALLVGGEPFEARPLMWWNFVARDRDEIDAAYADWQAGAERFGMVASSLAAIPAPPPLWSPRARPFQPR